MTLQGEIRLLDIKDEGGDEECDTAHHERWKLNYDDSTVAEKALSNSNDNPTLMELNSVEINRCLERP